MAKEAEIARGQSGTILLKPLRSRINVLSFKQEEPYSAQPGDVHSRQILCNRVLMRKGPKFVLLFLVIETIL